MLKVICTSICTLLLCGLAHRTLWFCSQTSGACCGHEPCPLLCLPSLTLINNLTFLFSVLYIPELPHFCFTPSCSLQLSTNPFPATNFFSLLILTTIPLTSPLSSSCLNYSLPLSYFFSFHTFHHRVPRYLNNFLTFF